MAALLSPRALELEAFLEAHQLLDWAWGHVDCTMMVADWIHAVRGVDPAHYFRMSYSTARGARKLIADWGGFEALIGRALDGFNLRRTDDPQTGDVGIVEGPCLWDGVPEMGQLLAVRQGEFWTARRRRGLVSQRFPMVAAWRV